MSDKTVEERLKELEDELHYLKNKDNPMEEVGDWRVVRGDWY